MIKDTRYYVVIINRDTLELSKTGSAIIIYRIQIECHIILL